MTDQNPTPQVSVQQLVALATGTGFGLSVSAAVIALIGLLLPFVGISTNLGMGLDQAGSLNGFEAASWVAWLALLVFVLAAASWRVIQIAPYRTILCWAGLVAAVIAILYGWFLNPAASQLAEVNRTMSALGAQGNAINVTPHIGMLILLIGGGVLAWAGRKGA